MRDLRDPFVRLRENVGSGGSPVSTFVEVVFRKLMLTTRPFHGPL